MRNSRFVLREEVDKVFEEHDKDLDGKLSWDEFCGEETKNEKAFKLMDINKNGKVSKEVSLYYFFTVRVTQNCDNICQSSIRSSVLSVSQLF